jgi:hypothetical protein
MPDTDRFEQELREQYPQPSAAATEGARAAVITARRQAIGRHPRRWGGIVVVPVALAVLAAFPIGVGVGATTLGSNQSHVSQVEAPVLSFRPAAGWNMVQTTVPNTPNDQEVAWTANVPIDSRDSVGGQPIHTVRDLPLDGIVIWAAALPAVSDANSYSEGTLPVQLAQGHLLSGQYENQPGPNVAQIGPIGIHAHGQYLTVIAWFGTAKPSSQLREQAQSELDNLQVPTS